MCPNPAADNIGARHAGRGQPNPFPTPAPTYSARATLVVDTLLEVGADRTLFSVDYPYESMYEIAPWFDSCPISENDRVKIGRTNAAKLFGLDD
ncbi:putative TIM-barrel fold metal-dependent hydrolase [Nocardia sp. GAS34]|uniref:amidohydrolase family protein n=1 Tax=unclassified Nocardia TaxID=2637762 RepID=UPI003D2188CF